MLEQILLKVVGAAEEQHQLVHTQAATMLVIMAEQDHQQHHPMEPQHLQDKM
jgi:hypothetical protein